MIVTVPVSPSANVIVPVPVLPLTVIVTVAAPLETIDETTSVVLRNPSKIALSDPDTGLPSCVVSTNTQPLVVPPPPIGNETVYVPE